MTQNKGYIIYEGASPIDPDTEIVMIAIMQSGNSKTGNMIQTYILVKDTDPREASKTGLDYAICGNCPHRGQPTNDPGRKLAVNRTCYVNIGQGVLIVWKQYKKGAYEKVTGHIDIARIGKGRNIRLGTYGDPALIPGYIWDSLLTYSTGRTGYTHQATEPGAFVRPDLTMISADSYQAAQAAWAQGYRTFRTVPIQESTSATLAQIDKANETLCPASEEAGKKVDCNKCKLCSGSMIKAKNIVIPLHDTKSNSIKRRQNLQLQGA